MSLPLKRIAVILEGRVQYERNVLMGIRDFAAKQGDWLIRLVFPGRVSASFFEEWTPDGVLFQSAGLESKFLRKLARFSAAIHLSESPRNLKLRSVGLDNRAIGKAAADYFQKREMPHFAFVKQGDSGFSNVRGESFQAEFSEPIPFLEIGPDTPENEIAEWLRALPKPCGLFANHDECSLFLTTICRSAGISVPEEIAILGVDDDQLICELAWPKLSSVAVPSRRVGFEAAERLNSLLEDGEKDSFTDSILLPPTGIITRHSTDVFQTEDEIVNNALRFMRSHLSQRINVDSVLQEIGVSRRLLERRFSKHLGRSPHSEIQRLRMEEAKRLLLETRIPLHEIAQQCGCSDASQLVTIFRREFGTTPGEFRKAKNSIA